MSCSLSWTERKYSQIEKEALSCVFGVTRFYSYLYGHRFTLQTDHKPLLVLFNKNKSIPTHAANRIQRWAWKVASYKYTIKWRNTHQHANADALSCLPLSEVPAEVVLLVELTYQCSTGCYLDQTEPCSRQSARECPRWMDRRHR